MVNPGYIVCVAYLAGLLLSGLSHSWVWGLVVGAIATVTSPWIWRYGPRRPTLAAATLASLAAGAYLQWRTPAPTLYDISQWVSANAEVNCISGVLENSPQLTRRGQLNAQLAATQIEISGAEEDTRPLNKPNPVARLLSDPVAVEGHLYVTLPLLQGTGLYPTQPIRACGTLYAPRPAQNPSGFDFAAYLGRQGIFAGLQATAVEAIGLPPPPLLWQLRQRIVHAFVRSLGSPEGVLLSAMVLGRRAVDLPHDVRDLFSQAGLAHTLAASGFHLSLLLGLFLAVTQRLSASLRLGLGTVVLLGYAGLTGLQPSICRAVLMGMAGLLGGTLGRKTRPVGLLLAIATLILLVNPIWIWDLGFQLSFMATLGLLVTTRPLIQWLDWLPTPVATAIAVPLAAIAWTLPIQLWAFSTLSLYSLPLNIVMTPLISLIGLVGMADGAIALVFPDLASVTAQGLRLPIQILMASVTWVNQLPGQTIALGQSLVQVGLIYGVFGLIHRARLRQRLGLSVLVVVLLLLPGWWAQRHLVQVTVLAGRSPVVVVQERGLVGVIGDAHGSALAYDLLPFLRRQGVNRIDWAVDINNQVGRSRDWQLDMAIQQQYRLTEGAIVFTEQGAHDDRDDAELSFGASTLRRLSEAPTILDLTILEQRWLIVGSPAGVPAEPNNAPDSNSLEMMPPAPRDRAASPQGILVWSGQVLPPQWLSPLTLEAAIATSDAVAPETKTELTALMVPMHIAGQSGAVQWRPGMAAVSLVEPNAEF